MNKERKSPNETIDRNEHRVGRHVAKALVGSRQTHRDIVVWPLFLPESNGITYQTLDEALKQGSALVKEVSASGSVPELFVVNKASEPLLILDGEEVVGAKQNRAVNSTLLLKPKSETVIPVSCTEEGRWCANSEEFSSSDVVMASHLRHKKMDSVSSSLKSGSGHQSDQGEVWDGIHAIACKAAFMSPTHAMNDLFAKQEKELEAALEAFPVQPGQRGLAVSVSGAIIGCDILSRSEAYRQLHDKLLRSYILDALLEKPGKASADDHVTEAFLENASSCREEPFPSVGLGTSVRLSNDEGSGAALVYEKTVVHVALFRRDEERDAGHGTNPMASFLSRRRNTLN
jgi:hypothetical protein